MKGKEKLQTPVIFAVQINIQCHATSPRKFRVLAKGKKIMTDIIGMIRLTFFVLIHPIATYRFLKDISVLIRVLTIDVFGHSINEDEKSWYCICGKKMTYRLEKEPQSDGRIAYFGVLNCLNPDCKEEEKIVCYGLENPRIDRLKYKSNLIIFKV